MGLSGTDIPPEARIVTLADVYDALGTKRVLKEAFDEDVLDKMIQESSGTHSDPDVTKVFFKKKEDLLMIKAALS